MGIRRHQRGNGALKFGVETGGAEIPGVLCPPPLGSAELHEMPWGMLLTNSESFLPKFIPEKKSSGDVLGLGGEQAKKKYK